MAISDWFARKPAVDPEIRNLVAFILSSCNAANNQNPGEEQSSERLVEEKSSKRKKSFDAP